MYGFVDHDKLNLICGSRLLQICFGVNEVILNLVPEGTQITITSITKFVADNLEIICKSPVDDKLFAGILGEVISNIEIIDEKRLVLYFTSGKSLAITDDSVQYESAIIRIGQELIVV